MRTHDDCVTVLPYFRVHPGKMEAFRDLCQRCVVQTQLEEDCLYYGFTFNGNEVRCREGYRGGEGVLAHVSNAKSLIEEALSIADLYRFEIHGPEQEIEKVKDTLAPFNPEYWTLEYGFRKEAVA